MSKAAAVKKENPVIRYLRDTRAEMRKVTWPSPEEARTLTVIVLIVTVAMSLLLGVLDYIFALLFRLLV